MSCPLSALANIAVMTANSPILSSAAAGSPPPFSSSLTALSAVMSHSSSPCSINSLPPKKQQPVKKRFVPDSAAAYSSSCSSSNLDIYANKFNYHGAWNNKCKKSSNNSKTMKQNQKHCRRQDKAKKSSFQANSQPSFPAVLMGIMSAPQNTKYISFLSDDKSVIIIHPDAVAQKVLPIHFEGCDVPTYDQFLSMLTLWGFEIVKDPLYPQVNVYNHPMFRKGDWEACLQMKLEEVCSPMNQAMNASPTQTPPPLQLPIDVFSSGRSSSQSPHNEARSVTPPETALGLLPYQAITQTVPQESASQWMIQSAMLEQMILATAETRRRLSGFRSMGQSSPMDEMAVNHELQGAYHQGMRDRSSSYSSAMTSSASSPLAQHDPEGLSHAQVSSMTSNVVSAAMAALHGSEQSSQQLQSGADSNSMSASSSSSSLNAKTEAFLERSNARRMKSRPAGIFGAVRSMTQRQGISDMVDAQTRALLARQ